MTHAATLTKVREQVSTHDCPKCGGPAYCAMEAGHSASLCWCMYVERDTNPETGADTCLCRRCLTGAAADTHSHL